MNTVYKISKVSVITDHPWLMPDWTYIGTYSEDETSRFIRTLHDTGYELETIDCVQNNHLRFAKTVNYNKTIYDMEPCFSTPIEDALHMIETA